MCRTSTICLSLSDCHMRRSSPRLTSYSGGPVIRGRPIPQGTGILPDDFGARLEFLKESSGLTWNGFAEAVGVELKQVLRWRKTTQPCGGALYSLIRLAPWIPGGLEALMGDDFLSPMLEE